MTGKLQGLGLVFRETYLGFYRVAPAVMLFTVATKAMMISDDAEIFALKIPCFLSFPVQLMVFLISHKGIKEKKANFLALAILFSCQNR